MATPPRRTRLCGSLYVHLREAFAWGTADGLGEGRGLPYRWEIFVNRQANVLWLPESMQ